MNNLSKILCGGALLFGLWSCASDEPVAVEIPTFEGDQAVVKITLFGASDITRADGPNSSYGIGSPDENAVTQLNFYFYDKAGEYVTCYENAKYEASSNSTSGLVEEIGTSRIVLTGLLGQNYPSYVVAVINYSDARFKQPLTEVAKVLRNSAPWTTTSSTTSNFVMTSATHKNNAADFLYFATPISEENFILQDESSKPDDVLDAEKGKPVDIYVERLAAKVALNIQSAENITVTEDGYYDVTLPDKYEIDGVKKTLKIRLYGWGVNGTAKTMKYFKAVNDNPNPFSTNDGWEYDGTNRSYWAKTPGYGENKYPASFDDVSIKGSSPNSSDDDDTAPNEPLNYISWQTVKDNKFANTKIAYVMPHTEAGEQINLTGNQIHHSAITEVLIAGQIIDNAGKGMTLFQLSEAYYTKAGVINYLLNAANTHIWKKTAENKFETIAPADVDVKYGYDGTFSIVVTNTAAEWYKDNEGTDKWASAADVAAEINAYLPDKQSYCYNDGMLYYNIPIRHLRPGYTPGVKILTGMFGVVRNHWYEVTVSGIKNLGHSVYRRHEHIIPPSDDTRYMIGSSVKILSWRLVKSTVEL